MWMKFILLIFLLFVSIISFSQKDTSYWNHVHHQTRLVISSYDSTVVGRVMKVTRELDGDYHLIIRTDSTHTIVAEIICACRGVMVACKGYRNVIKIPKRGDYIVIVGDSVIDKIHEDLPEIHPVKGLVILEFSIIGKVFATFFFIAVGA